MIINIELCDIMKPKALCSQKRS